MEMDTTYFFVGIKGTGMSSLALILHDKGCKVLGSDIDKYTFTQRGLEQAGIEIRSFDAANIQPGMTVIRGTPLGTTSVKLPGLRKWGFQLKRTRRWCRT